MKKSSAKKTPTKPRSPSRKEGASRYSYHELNKAPLTSADPVHFYGVITDATFPYKVHADRFICSLRVTDPTMKNQTAQVVIYAKRFEDLPIVHRLGDIVRVHRANLRMYKNQRQFNVNVYYKSSWALYSTDRTTPLGAAATDSPYAFSGSKPTVERQDNAILSTLKSWARGYFQQNAVVDGGKTAALKKAVQNQGDFDVNARILQVFELDEYTNELKLRDLSGETYFTLALKLKFPHLRQGAAVRIRSATVDETSKDKRVLVLQHYSNIMTFVSTSKVGSALSKVGDDRSAEKSALKGSTSMLPVVLTEVDKKHQGLQTTSLYDLFHGNQSGNTFRTCFYVTKVEPSAAEESVVCYDKKTKRSASAKTAKGDLVHRMQFLAKDVSTQFNNNVYRILLYTHEGLGQNFLGRASNLHKDAGALKRVKEQCATLTRFNSWVDAVVERRNGYYFIKDTRMVM